MSMKTSGKHDKDGRLIQPKYPDGRTKQAFKDETDINKILFRAQKAGVMSHLEKYQGSYGDFADYDFFEETMKMTKGREVFDALPSELRTEFNQSPAEFFDYVNDPANIDDLRKRLPGLAMPGRQNIDLSGRTPPDDPPAPTQGAQATEEPPPAVPEETAAAAKTEPEAT